MRITLFDLTTGGAHGAGGRTQEFLGNGHFRPTTEVIGGLVVETASSR